MSDKTAIEWTDATWNPVTGCTKVSPGCDHCYAETFAERWRGTPGHYFQDGFNITLRPDKLTLPLTWRKPRRIFVNSMSDLFHEKIPDTFILAAWRVMARCPQHTFQILTKRHARMRSFVGRLAFAGPTAEERGTGVSGRVPYLMPSVEANRSLGRVRPLDNVWLGVSVENQQWADIRVPVLLDTSAVVRWLSCEPLIGPVELGQSADVLDWVVAGGESGAGARPMHPDWARSLRDQCRAAAVPFLFKQWGEYSPMAPMKNGVFDWGRGVIMANDGTVYGKGDLDYPDGPRYGEAIRARHDRANLSSMYRVGKKAAGRELDERTWDEYPSVAS